MARVQRFYMTTSACGMRSRPAGLHTTAGLLLRSSCYLERGVVPHILSDQLA